MGKKKRTRLGREFWERDRANMKFLEERVAYHQRKLEEERAAREREQGS
jgi:hypothetical protein